MYKYKKKRKEKRERQKSKYVNKQRFVLFGLLHMECSFAQWCVYQCMCMCKLRVVMANNWMIPSSTAFLKGQK